MEDENKQDRIAYSEIVYCPACDTQQEIELTTEQDYTTQVYFCDNCGSDFAVRVSFFIELEVCALKPVRKRRK